MRLGILCNFGPYPSKGGSVGGSEAVLAAISERLISNYNYKVNIYGYNYERISTYNGINLFPCEKGNGLIAQIAQNDHIFIYSDSFWGFDTLLGSIKTIDCRVSCALVGSYHLQSHSNSFRLLKESLHKFNLITHSSITPDYKFCIDNDLPVEVMPNGVELNEFSSNIINFKDKYKIKEKYVILSVFSYFYGKGFEIISKIARKLDEQLDDFVILQLSNIVKYPYDKIFLDRTKEQCKGLPVRFMRDLPRKDVVAAFQQSDIFLQTSRKEVAPIVILESRAAKLPFVSMDVGNTRENFGGVIITNKNEDHKGYKIVNDLVVNRFVTHIAEILESDKIIKYYIDEGQEDIEQIDWDNIVPLYDEIFRK